jgi:MoaA/NifB/PqqE/SkfB family radical SAM enzyme
MIVGQGVCRSLERIAIPVTLFLDSSVSLQGRKALGYEIRKPDEAFEEVRSGRGLIIAGSGHCDLEIGELCSKAGLKQGRDYILSRELNDIDPSIDVAGMCNLKCISCPRGNDSTQTTSGYMSAATYKRVLDKLIDEIPLLGSVQLYAWGEPLLNAELPEIILITREAKVLTAISTNLNYGRNLEAVVSARPDWIKVSCSGWGESYELTHTGGKWDLFLTNLHKLAELRDRIYPEMQITLNYHLYRQNIGEDYRRMEALCRELSLIFRPSPAYLYPADAVMDYIDGKELSPEANKTLPLLLMSLDEGIAKARERVAQPCPEERCLPINWDCSVRECGVYFRSFIVDNFMETPLTEIIKKKRKSRLCAECKKRGVHQFTAVYLAEKRLYDAEACG